MAKAREQDKLSFILYTKQLAPRYYEISRNYFKFLTVGLPVITFICIGGLIAFAVYFKQLEVLAKRKEPVVINNLREDNLALTNKINELDLLNKSLENKLASPVQTDREFGTLSLFKQVQGQKDLSKSPALTLEEVEVVPVDNDIALNFKIVNATKDGSRQAGYLFVIMKAGNQIALYPEDAFERDEMQLSFNKGEYFATSRFRPVRAVFPRVSGTREVLFKIVIFSATGDLVQKQIVSQALGTP
tara:strand:- start:3134 stop:3868 length:735 start_codon:yes stop_codon:yes gene_type:complete